MLRNESSKINFFHENNVCVDKNIYLCRTKFEAIHNKDYSVVKTFRAGPKASFFFLYLIHCQQTHSTFCIKLHSPQALPLAESAEQYLPTKKYLLIQNVTMIFVFVRCFIFTWQK